MMTKPTNTAIGTTTENKVSELFGSLDYWAHIFHKSDVGSQPVDVIAVRKKTNYVVWLVDAKHVREEDASFRLSRIEPNQWMTLQFAHDVCGIDIETLGFVIEFERTEELYWLGLKEAIDMRDNDVKSVNLKLLKKFEEVVYAFEDK